MHTQDSFDTPVLFLIFNRPDVTEKVFGQIKKVQPTQLFIAADGPRDSHPEDIEKCRVTREVVLKMIDWDCEVKTLFRGENLGCGLAVSQAITWFFEHVEMGIILEDDCYPDLSFFGFCIQLLDYYKNDANVMHIGGTNWQLGKKWGDGSYYFSNETHVWGWATWKTAWMKYDHEMKEVADHGNEALFTEVEGIKKDERKEYIRIFKAVKGGKIDSWAYRWKYSIWKEGGISIIPNYNLVKNIGFDINSTHTTNEPRKYLKIGLESIASIHHPHKMKVQSQADYIYYRRFLKSKPILLRQINYYMRKVAKILWTYAPRDYVLSFSKKRIQKEYQPKWETIKGGPASGKSIFIDKSEFSGWNKMIEGDHDSFLFSEVQKNIELKGKVVWDIGAHFGYHSISFSILTGNKGQVHSFEPNEYNYQRLLKNIKYNSIQNIQTHSIALSVRVGETGMMISDNVEGSQSTGSYLIEGEKPLPDETYKKFNFTKATVRQDTIDNFIKTTAKPDVIKIDVEGAELLVLQGGIGFLAEFRPILLIEVHNIILMHEILSLLHRLNYSSRIIGKEDASKSRCFIYAAKT